MCPRAWISASALSLVLSLAVPAWGQAGSGPSIAPGSGTPGQAPSQSPRTPDRAGREAAATSTRLVDLRPRFERGQQIRFTMEVTSTTDQNLGVKFGSAMGSGEDEPDARPAATPADRTTDSPRRDRTAPPASTNSPSSAEDAAIRSTVRLGLVMRVKDVPAGGGATVDLTVDSIRASSTFLGEEHVFDSTKTDAAPGTTAAPRGTPSGGGSADPLAAAGDDALARAMKPLVGATMTLTLDAAGNITSITGGQALAALGGSLTAAGGPSLPGMPGGKSLFQSIFTVSGTKPQAAVGELWTVEDVIDSGLLGEFRMTNTHRLASAGPRDAVIESQGSIRGTSELGGESAFRITSSSFRGRTVWDRAAGMIREMTQDMTVGIDGTLMGEKLTTTSVSRVRVVRETR